MMGNEPNRLSRKSAAVLEMIAGGSTYEQILSALPALTYLDIFRAAEEALDCMARQAPVAPPAPKYAYSVDDIRIRYPRAYEKWTEQEELRLRTLIAQRLTVAQIARRLQRQRSAIRSRIMKLNLVNELAPHEQERLLRISKLDPRDADPSGTEAP